ncbi:hypothetical protein OXYTRIMIC_012 [Oxytricha trifallax]|uniref:Uncharacterized protein n=1 Tax=Oxytricha trifallax TaxID=1172189 RepID=A0A073I0R3_9SPIT|nr:hypothetical protein OXYTRIMIC_012 [Oxytricha trifallax]
MKYKQRNVGENYNEKSEINQLKKKIQQSILKKEFNNMEEQKSQNPYQSNYYQSYDNKKRSFRDDDINQKTKFWQKGEKVRYEHIERSKNQEVQGLRDNKHQKVLLNKQMGFKSRLRIGQSNPRKNINETQAQRTRYDVHED